MLAVRMISNCVWLSLIDTRRKRSAGFQDRLHGALDFRTIYRVSQANTESKVYLQLPLIQLIDRGISAMAGHRGHMGYNDDILSDNGGGYLPFNYVAIMGSRVLVS